MSKANAIRKRALDCVRKRNWEGAVREYRRLSELDQNNPNIYNELGDLYLKLGDRGNAFRSFESAIEAYARVSLFNNAVAVCKKVLRLNPNKPEILFKLGSLRKQQGLLKEATSYFLSYMEKIVLDVSIEHGAMKDKVVAVAKEMEDSPEVLEKVVDYLLRWEFASEAGDLLVKLHGICKQRGWVEKRQAVEKRLESLGISPENIRAPLVAKGEKRRALPGFEYRDISLEGLGGEGEDVHAGTSRGGQEGEPSRRVEGRGEVCSAGLPGVGESEAAGRRGEKTVEVKAHRVAPPGKPSSESEVWSAKGGSPERKLESEDGTKGEVIHVSKIIDEFRSEVKDSIDNEDYRSHYDLGMAYLEMDLLPEAVREFQLAGKSSAYRIRSLEMIGLCFLKQEQPGLAIKQLEKGLAMVQGGERESLGLWYNLGLAYEMMGEGEKAKSCFEEVYLLDVAFRDVDEKLRKYSS